MAKLLEEVLDEEMVEYIKDSFEIMKENEFIYVMTNFFENKKAVYEYMLEIIIDCMSYAKDTDVTDYVTKIFTKNKSTINAWIKLRVLQYNMTRV